MEAPSDPGCLSVVGAAPVVVAAAVMRAAGLDVAGVLVAVAEALAAVPLVASWDPRLGCDLRECE